MSGPADRHGDGRGGDSVPHDAWLREALRHAPDADALPPAALSETILRRARAEAAAAARPVTPSLGARIAAAWAWLGRPPVAAGFASVMVAGVVGLMWWDRPLEEALPPRDAAVPAAAPAATPAPPVVAAAPAPAPAPAPEPATAPTTQAETPPPPAPAPPPPPTAIERRQAPVQAPARPAAPPAAAEIAAAPTPAPFQLPSRALADAAPGGAAAESERRAAAAVREERDERSRAVAAMSKAAPAAAATAPAPALRRDAAAGAASSSGPLEALRNAIAAQPERWRWQRDAGAPRAVEGVLQQWLARADAYAGTRWSAAAIDATAAAGGDGIAVQFWFDERLHTILRLDAGGLVVEPAGGPRRRAELTAADAAALRDALDAATR